MDPIDKKEQAKDLRRRLLAFIFSLSLLVLSKFASDMVGLAILLSAFSLLIFYELHVIRSTLIQVYAEAITESKFLHFFLKRKLINGILTAIISIYLATSLLLFTSLSSLEELVIIGLSGLILTVITPSIAQPWFRNGPAQMFGRVAVVSIFVILAVIIDGTYTVLSPIDPRIREPFDENIPAYVIEDVQHSVLYFQHLLRSLKYIDMNIDSIELCSQRATIELCPKIDHWFYIFRFIFVLSPAPYIAYALLLLSMMSIRVMFTRKFS